MSRDKIVRTEFQENKDEKVKVMIRLTTSQFEMLQNISREMYRGISNSHTVRCLIEDAWEQWNKGKEVA